jgi:hypothetical protein
MSEIPAGQQKSLHYYGDIVRDCFLVAALLMLIGLPWFVKYLTVPLPFSLLSIAVLALAAGLTNPVLYWSAIVNVVVSVAGFFVFEAGAVQAYVHYSPESKFFAANQLLAVIFVLALYYSVKTLRGFFLNR